MADLYVPDLPDECGVLEAAIAYANAGWYVVPIRRNARKHPGSVVGKGWQHKSSRDPQMLAAWFAGTDHGVALHLGRSGALVFDVDYPDRLPDVLAAELIACAPPFQTTRSNGHPDRGHNLFTMPPGRMLGNGTGKLGGAWGEIRGRNGIIVVAPSPHDDEASGGLYQWRRTGPVPMLPDTVGRLLSDAADTEEAATDAEVEAFLNEHTDSVRSHLLAGWVTIFNTKVAAGESRHMRMTTVCAGAMKEARAGYFPARKAAQQLEAAFLTAVGKDPIPGSQQRDARAGGVARSEWAGILAWAVAQAKTAHLDQIRARVAEQMPDTYQRAPEDDPWGDTEPPFDVDATLSHPNAGPRNQPDTIVGPVIEGEVSDEPARRDEPAAAVDWASLLQDGGSWLFDGPVDLQPIWGADGNVIWPEGESLIIAGPPGVGKTTLTGQVVRARLGLAEAVLGMPVRRTARRVLYLAMDRPRQIRRALLRQFTPEERRYVAERLIVWQGPPPADLAKYPGLLRELGRKAGADTIIIVNRPGFSGGRVVPAAVAVGG